MSIHINPKAVRGPAVYAKPSTTLSVVTDANTDVILGDTAAASSAARAAYFAELDKQVERFNLLFKNLGVPLECYFNRNKEFSKIQANIAENISRGESVKKFYDTSTECADEIVLYLLRSSVPHAAIRAHTQVGKTGTQIQVAYACNILSAFDLGPRAVVTPHKTEDSEKTFKKDIEEFKNFYGPLRFRNTANSDCDVIAFDSEIVTPRVVVRTTQKGFAEIADKMNTDGKNNLVCVVDETDFGSGNSGSLKKTVVELRKRNINVSLVACSATGEEYESREDIKVVDLKPGEGYRGLFCGLSVQKITDFAHGYNVEKADDLSVQTNITAMLNFIATLNNEGIDNAEASLNGKPLNGGKGLIVLFGNAATSENFVSHARLHFHGIKPAPGARSLKVVEYFGKNITDTQIEDVVKEHDARDENVLFVVKGACRRAVRVPQSVPLFIDTTLKYSTHAALIQGGTGRMTGYKTDTVVFLSNANFDLARDTCVTGRPQKKNVRTTFGSRKVKVQTRMVTIDLVNSMIRVSAKGASTPLDASVTAAIIDGITKSVSWGLVAGHNLSLTTPNNAKANLPNVAIPETIAIDPDSGRYVVEKNALFGGKINEIVDAAQGLFSTPVTADTWWSGCEGYVAVSISEWNANRRKGASGAKKKTIGPNEREDHARGLSDGKPKPEISFDVECFHNGEPKRNKDGSIVTVPKQITFWFAGKVHTKVELLPTKASMHHEDNTIKVPAYIDR